MCADVLTTPLLLLSLLLLLLLLLLNSQLYVPLVFQETAATLVAMAAEQKSVSLTVIFGHHLRAGPAPEVSR